MTVPSWVFWEKRWVFWVQAVLGLRSLTPPDQFGIECRGMNSNGRPIPGFTHCFKSNDMAFFDGLDYLVSVLPKTSATDNIINSDSLKRTRSE
jgi:phosphoglycerate dehydrogenase-like enzyme